MAVIASSSAPLLFLDGDLRIIAGSQSFGRAFNIAPDDVAGRMLTELGEGEWGIPQLTALLKAAAAGFARIEAYGMDLVRAGHAPRRLVINAHKLDDGDVANVRLLLSVTDVTDARAADAAHQVVLQEKAVLLREVQHRIANSLQIIASILLQTARRMPSEEMRGHLRSAHLRVLSIAEVQRQLMTSSVDDVSMKPYLTRLCESLGASMISDPTAMSITVSCDDATMPAESSISVGLLVTELVINALKHAFPGQHPGGILVSFSSNGDDWSLVVSDNGVGMANAPDGAKAGLGTSILEAVARQLQASITSTDADPGTTVSIVHDHSSAMKAMAPL
jgi:two-component system, sensor histidine kinase PdtaS